MCSGLIARLRQPKSANSENRPLFGLWDVGVRSLANSAERTKSLPFEVRVNDLKEMFGIGLGTPIYVVPVGMPGNSRRIKFGVVKLTVSLSHPETVFTRPCPWVKS